MYRLRDFTENPVGNLFGGLTAAVVALPLGLAFGIASGAGPIAGLYGAIMVGFFASVSGGTRTQVSGPTGPMTVVMTAVIADLLASHPQDGLAIAFATVVLGGLLQIAMGALRLGRYIIMVPYPVISGFMSGIGVIIILLQLGPLLGFKSAGGIMGAVRQLPEQILQPDQHALVLAALTLLIVFLWRGRLNRLLPSPLLALVVATLALLWFAPDSPIDRIGAIPSGFPSLRWPVFEPALLPEMFTNALMLAVLGAIDSLLTSLVADSMTRTHHDSDRELIGQGIGNTVAGLFGGLPGAGATMRTVVNIRAGGSGPASGAIHSLVLLAIVSGLGFLFEDIPLVVLAGILVKVGIDIIDWSFVRRARQLPPFTVVLTLLVFGLTVFVDLITAVFVGVFIKNMVTLEKLSDLQLGELVLSDGHDGGEDLSADERTWLGAQQGQGLVLRIDGPLSYAVGRRLGLRLDMYPDFDALLIDLRRAAIVGISTAMLLEDVVARARQRGAPVQLVGAQGKSLAELQRLGVCELVGQDNCFEDMAALIDPGNRNIPASGS